MDNSFSVIFDMDGVLVNTLQALYDIYLNALSNQGVQGSRDEFNEMNGPHMEDVVSILSQRHNLKKAQLKEDFSQLHATLYDRATLTEGALFLIKSLHHQGIQLAIASSASKSNILKILARYELSHYFTAIISGDDVVKAKPHPELYLKAKSYLSTSLVFGVDDSPLGVTSMASAGVCPIHFLNNETPVSPSASYHVNTMSELPSIFEKHCILLFKGDNFSITEIEPINKINRKSIAKHWQSIRTENLYNGNAVLCHGIHKNELLVSPSDYKTVLFIFSQAQNFKAKPLGVSGLVIDDEGNIITAQRASETTQYPLYWELPPSGSVEATEQTSIIDHIYQELNEELNIQKQQVDFTKILGVTYDRNAQNYDILILIKLNCSAKQSKINNEYKDVRILNRHQLESELTKYSFTPESHLKLHLSREILNENC